MSNSDTDPKIAARKAREHSTLLTRLIAYLNVTPSRQQLSYHHHLVKPDISHYNAQRQKVPPRISVRVYHRVVFRQFSRNLK